MNEGNVLPFPRGKPPRQERCTRAETRISLGDNASRIDQTDIGGWISKIDDGSAMVSATFAVFGLRGRELFCKGSRLSSREVVCLTLE